MANDGTSQEKMFWRCIRLSFGTKNAYFPAYRVGQSLILSPVDRDRILAGIHLIMAKILLIMAKI